MSCSGSNDSGWLYVFINGHSSPNDLNTYMFRLNPRNNVVNSMSFTTPADGKYMNLRVGTFYSGDRKEFSNIQIEENSIQTEYEPYILTSSTQVTQNKNHTLTAIWEEN